MNLKNEKGSITVYVLVAVFFLMAILVGRFIIANRNLKVQYDSLSRVKSLYETNAKRYENYINPDDKEMKKYKIDIKCLMKKEKIN